MIARWHILGAGSMGRLMGCKLVRIGFEAVLLTRTDPAPAEPVILRENGSEQTYPLKRRQASGLASGSVQGMLVTTKANQAVAAVRSAIHSLQDGAPVVLLHNGMGVLEELAALYPALNLHAGTTTEGAYRDGRVLVHAGRGDTIIGREGAACPDWFQAFARSAERFQWDAHIDDMLWRKLLVNCAINPLTALHRCHNGTLLDNPALRAEVERVSEELAAISAARGNQEAADRALDQALAVIRATADNRSSMLQDIELRRPTEIEYITGYLVREARRLSVPCPRNERLLAEVRRLDSNRASN